MKECSVKMESRVSEIQIETKEEKAPAAVSPQEERQEGKTGTLCFKRRKKANRTQPKAGSKTAEVTKKRPPEAGDPAQPQPAGAWASVKRLVTHGKRSESSKKQKPSEADVQPEDVALPKKKAKSRLGIPCIRFSRGAKRRHHAKLTEDSDYNSRVQGGADDLETKAQTQSAGQAKSTQGRQEGVLVEDGKEAQESRVSNSLTSRGNVVSVDLELENESSAVQMGTPVLEKEPRVSTEKQSVQAQQASPLESSEAGSPRPVASDAPASPATVYQRSVEAPSGAIQESVPRGEDDGSRRSASQEKTSGEITLGPAEETTVVQAEEAAVSLTDKSAVAQAEEGKPSQAEEAAVSLTDKSAVAQAEEGKPSQAEETVRLTDKSTVGQAEEGKPSQAEETVRQTDKSAVAQAEEGKLSQAEETVRQTDKSAVAQAEEGKPSQAEETAVSQTDKSAVAQAVEATVGQAVEVTVTQEEEAAVAQEEEAAVTQADKAAVSQEEEAAVSQEEEAAVTQADKAAVAQAEEAAVSQEEEAAVSQEEEAAVTQADKAAVSQAEEAAVSQEEEAAVTQADKTAVTQEEEAAVSQEEEAAVAREEEIAVAQEEEAAVAREEEITVAQAPDLKENGIDTEKPRSEESKRMEPIAIIITDTEISEFDAKKSKNVPKQFLISMENEQVGVFANDSDFEGRTSEQYETLLIETASSLVKNAIQLSVEQLVNEMVSEDNKINTLLQ
ncbi:A-kinase anchor protein 5 isoform X1 [Peromyscus maniculatus bairdii]|uniref:A-kinase anchor protein 5 isoform X1 n=1 Tax=Peromyscus maniculatus bairdii TaxID=230844 RepID=UPI00077DB459